MEPELILIQSSQCQKEVIFGELHVWVNLPTGYQFAERTHLRLHSTAGLPKGIYVIASFAKPVPCGSELRRLVGLTNNLPGPWTSVEGNSIASLVTIQLGRAGDKNFINVPKKPFNLLFELCNGRPSGYS